MKKALLLAAALVPFLLRAEDTPPAPAPAPAVTQEDREAAAQKIVDGLHFRQGEVKLGDGFAQVQVPDEFRFLGPDDAETLLTKLWGNPPDKDKPLGLLMPAGVSPLSDESWAVIVTYDNDGYVKDGDANKIDYTKMLAELKKSSHDANAERTKQGYPAIELVGWAAAPRYDATAHKLYWAKEIQFGDAKENTLNYNIRVLGRKGVLILNAVASMKQLPDVEKATPAILQMIDFTDGNRYADYKPGTDKIATYGLAALVAGGIAAKVGLFKGLWIAILALKKFIIIGVVAAGAWLRRLFGKKAAGS
jgi:uncharacterized membrane-anchored protein